MIAYIQAVKRQFRDKYGFVPVGGTDNEPMFDKIPDGEYPMDVMGKTDYVLVVSGSLNIGRYREELAKPVDNSKQDLIKVLIESYYGEDIFRSMVKSGRYNKMKAVADKLIELGYSNTPTPVATGEVDWERVKEAANKYAVEKYPNVYEYNVEFNRYKAGMEYMETNFTLIKNKL